MSQATSLPPHIANLHPYHFSLLALYILTTVKITTQQNPFLKFTSKALKSSSFNRPIKALYPNESGENWKQEFSMKSSSKKLSEMVEKWRKRKKGHFAVYTKEGKRFVVPLYYLNHPIFRVLLEMAEEEFGTTVDGPLTIPCEEELMDYILSLLRRNPSGVAEKSLISCKDQPPVSSLLPLFHGQNQAKPEAAVS